MSNVDDPFSKEKLTVVGIVVLLAGWAWRAIRSGEFVTAAQHKAQADQYEKQILLVREQLTLIGKDRDFWQGRCDELERREWELLTKGEAAVALACELKQIKQQRKS